MDEEELLEIFNETPDANQKSFSALDRLQLSIKKKDSAKIDEPSKVKSQQQPDQSSSNKNQHHHHHHHHHHKQKTSQIETKNIVEKPNPNENKKQEKNQSSLKARVEENRIEEKKDSCKLKEQIKEESEKVKKAKQNMAKDYEYYSQLLESNEPVKKAKMNDNSELITIKKKPPQSPLNEVQVETSKPKDQPKMRDDQKQQKIQKEQKIQKIIEPIQKKVTDSTTEKSTAGILNKQNEKSSLQIHQKQENEKYLKEKQPQIKDQIPVKKKQQLLSDQNNSQQPKPKLNQNDINPPQKEHKQIPNISKTSITQEKHIKPVNQEVQIKKKVQVDAPTIVNKQQKTVTDNQKKDPILEAETQLLIQLASNNVKKKSQQHKPKQKKADEIKKETKETKEIKEKKVNSLDQKQTKKPIRMQLQLGAQNKKSSVDLKELKKKAIEDQYDLQDSFIDDDIEAAYDSDQKEECQKFLSQIKTKKLGSLDEDEDLDIPSDGFDELEKQNHNSRELGRYLDRKERNRDIMLYEEKEKRKKSQKAQKEKEKWKQALN